MKRREFLKAVGIAGGAVAAASLIGPLQTAAERTEIA